MDNDEYITAVRQITVPIDQVDDNRIQSYQWLSNEIYSGKKALKNNSVEFIIAKILNQYKNVNNRIYQREYFDLYVIGSFRKTFKPTYNVAQSLAEYYLEVGIMPNVICIPKHVLIKNSVFFNKLKNGVILYERM